MHKNTSLELLRTPILVFSATKQIREACEATDAQNFFLSQKKLLM